VFSLATAVIGGYCEIGASYGVLCDHSLQDFAAPSIAAIVGVTLVPTARRLRQDPPRLGTLVGVGVVVGLAVAVLPIVLILRAADLFGDFNIFGSKVPTVGLVLLFAGPLLWALQSALTVWRHAGRRDERRTVLTGLGGGTLIAVVATLLVGRVGDMAVASSPTMAESIGTATLRLERPVEHVATGRARCSAGGGEHLSVELDAGGLPVEGRPVIHVAVIVERDNAPYLWITVADDETEHEMGSPPDSILEARRDGPSGSFRFTNLDGTSYRNGEAGPLDLHLEGTIEWTCPSE